VRFDFVVLTAYVIYLPVFLLLLNLAKRRYKGYSLKSFWISNLGELNSPSHRIFTPSLLVLGVLNLFFISYLRAFLPDSIFSQTAALFLYVSAFSSILIVFFPMDTKPKEHELISYPLFFGILGSSLLLIYPLSASDKIPSLLILLNLLVIVFATLLMVSFWRLTVKYQRKLGDHCLQYIRKEKSFFLKNVTLWEWIFLYLVILWSFVIGIIVLLWRY
jgi:hypothetical membrane protein